MRERDKERGKEREQEKEREAEMDANTIRDGKTLINVGGKRFGEKE